ncbi:MAG: hypothetical protein GEV04_08945 [Actinophytocola sp.]|nr:hypothetical protein [Actinophytocola sp.]
MTWLGVTFGIAFGSAIVPVISIEVFVLGMASAESAPHWALIGAVVALGQLTGKMPYYLAARGSIRLPSWLHRTQNNRPASPRRERFRLRTKRIKMWFETLRERCHRHPHWMAGTLGCSAVIGMPPFMGMAVIAGLARLRLSMFLGIGMVGRFARFGALAASPALFASWFHF